MSYLAYSNIQDKAMASTACFNNRRLLALFLLHELCAVNQKITSDESQPLDTVEVSVFNGHDSLVGEQLLGVIVDQLTVDENVNVVLADFLNLGNKNKKG